MALHREAIRAIAIRNAIARRSGSEVTKTSTRSNRRGMPKGLLQMCLESAGYETAVS